MADPDAAGQVRDPFAAVLGDTTQPFGPPLASAVQPTSAPAKDPFSDILGDAVADPAPSGSSAPGAFVRGAVRGAAPAAAGLVAAGEGAEAGGEAGLLFGPWGAAAGVLIGGLAGGFGGSYVAGKAQDYALSKAPAGWVEALGQDDRQQRLDQEEHHYASFMGGLFPFALTMKPGGFTKPPGWENFTGLQRTMANPVTARVFGGAMVGGIELGQEASEGDVDWNKVAISTAFGLVFNKPNRIGETIEGSVPRLFGRVGAIEARPTIAEAADAKVAGPGITKDVFEGSHRQDPVAEAVAQDAARTEASIIGPKPEVAIAAEVQKAEPDLVAARDVLVARRDELATAAEERPEDGAARTALSETDEKLAAVQTDIGAATRRIAEAKGSPIAEPAPIAASPADQAQHDFIVNDVKRQFVAAGRPEDEAEALGHIVADRFEKRAADFDGALGTADELYRKEGATIRGEDGVARAVKPGGEAPSPAAPEPVVIHPEQAEAAAAGAAQKKADRLGLTKLIQQLAARDVTPAEIAALIGKKMTAAEISAVRPAPAAPTVQDRIRQAVREVGGGQWNQRVSLADLRARLPDVPRTDLDAALADMHVKDNFHLSGSDNPGELTPEMRDAGLDYKGEPMQFAWQTREPEEEREQNRGGVKQGRIRLRPGQRSLITILKTADASTGIHELGHDFFEQLRRDAQHGQAPARLREDWRIAERETGGDHEKFADGYMRWISEGTAPTHALARLFERFRDWMLSLFDSVKGRNIELSDAMRAVYSRLHQTEGRRTVIAPESPRQRTLTDLHAEDAANAEHPDPAAERIAAERAEPPPREIANEIAPSVVEVEAERAAASGAAEPGREAGHGGERSAEVEHGGGKAGSEPSGSGVGGESGAERAGGTEAPTESRGTATGGSAAGRSDAGDPLRNTPLAPRPAEFLTAPKRFVDKAGNIRLDNVKDADDIKAAMREVAAANNDFIGDRRAIVTDKQAETTAEQWGDERITRKIVGEGWSAEENLAAQRLAAQAAHDSSMAAKTYAASGSDADLLVYAEKRSRHLMMQAYYARATAESGRALRALRKVQEYWTPEAEAAAGVIQAPKPSPGETIAAATGRTLYQLAAEAKLLAAYDDPSTVASFIARTQRHSFGRMILEYWINGLISGTATHTTYVVGNTLLSLEKGLLETPVAAAIGAARGRQVVHFGEAAARLRGAVVGYAPAVQQSAEAFRTGLTGRLPGQAPARALPFQPKGAEAIAGPALDEAATMADAKSAIFGAARGILDGALAVGKILEASPPGEGAFGAQYSALGAIPDIRVRGGVLPTGQIARLPSRAIATIHTFFRAMNYSIEKNALAYRQAANEGLTAGARDARIAALIRNTPDDIVQASAKGATDLTLMGPASEFTRKLTALTNWAPNIPGLGETPVLKFIDPFVHIASNIIDQSIIQRTPVGLLSGEIRRDLMGANGPAAQDMAQARMVVGTALALGFGTLAAKGLASGSGPMDRDKAAMWRLAGNQAHSVRIGDIWYQTNRLGPLGMLLGISADLYDVAHAASQGDMLQAAAYLQHAITQNVLDESFMRGPADLIQAAEDPGRYGERYVQNFASSFLPYSVAMAQMDRATDPFTRQARTVMEAIKQKIPGQSETLFPRRDVWGNEIPNHDALVAAGLTAIYESQMSRDPVNIALAGMGTGIGPVDRTIRNVQLTEQQYDDFARVAGVMLKRRLDVLVNSPDWRQRWTVGEKADLIKETLRGSRETSEGWMFGKYPSILAQATRQTRQKYAPSGGFE